MGSGLGSEIDRRLFLQYLAAAGLASPFVAGAAAADTDGSTGVNVQGLAKVFANPPPGASPGAYWYWLGGNVTRAGITADLEAMQAAGIHVCATPAEMGEKVKQVL